MPETVKGRKIKAAMKKSYGAEKGEQVFYASANAGKIKGVHKKRAKRKEHKRGDGDARMAKMYGDLDL